MKYTAREIVAKTGKNPDEVLGKVGVDIGGIAVSHPDHILNTQDAEKVTVTIGTEAFEVDIPEEDELEMSEGVKAIRAAEEAEALAKESEAKTE